MNNTKIITNEDTRWYYPNIFQPAVYKGSKPKYSIMLVFSKNDDDNINRLKKAIQNAYSNGEKFFKDSNGILVPINKIILPLRDGDKEHPDNNIYKNAYFMNAKSATKPGVIDVNCTPITDQSMIVNGCLGRASISFKPYNYLGQMGISCVLNHLQLIEPSDYAYANDAAIEEFGACPVERFMM